MNIYEAPIAGMCTISSISIAFDVQSVFEITQQDDSNTRFSLLEQRVQIPYRKDYDACSENKPEDWQKTFDTRNWGLIFAREDNHLIGSALIAHDTPGVDMLENRTDLAVLWDLRVAPEHRGHGVGTALFEAVKTWAAKHDCRDLKIETQNNNVPAVKFYLRQSCALRQAIPHAYPELPEEQMLLFYTPILNL